MTGFGLNVGSEVSNYELSIFDNDNNLNINILVDIIKIIMNCI